MVYDNAVIGLGPAGASFARLIDSRQYKVIAFDKKDPRHPESHPKPCGGLLSPDALRALSRFDLPIPREVVATPQIFYVKIIDMDTRVTRNYPRFYLNIDRQKFDLWLMSLIPDSVTVCCDTLVTRICPSDGLYKITYRRNGSDHTVTAKSIVGADGARSIVTRTFFNRGLQRLRLSIQEWYPHNSHNPFFSCIFDSHNSDSYAWSLCKDGYIIFGGAYRIGSARKAFDRQKEKLAQYGVSLPAPVKREACLVRRLHSFSGIDLGHENVLLLGEAAGFVSPSSYEGISGAMDSARLLSRVFNQDHIGILKRYKKAAWRMRLKYSMKVLKSAVLCSPFLRRLIMKSGINTIDVIDKQPPIAGKIPSGIIS